MTSANSVLALNVATRRYDSRMICVGRSNHSFLHVPEPLIVLAFLLQDAADRESFISKAYLGSSPFSRYPSFMRVPLRSLHLISSLYRRMFTRIPDLQISRSGLSIYLHFSLAILNDLSTPWDVSSLEVALLDQGSVQLSPVSCSDTSSLTITFPLAV